MPDQGSPESDQPVPQTPQWPGPTDGAQPPSAYNQPQPPGYYNQPPPGYYNQPPSYGQQPGWGQPPVYGPGYAPPRGHPLAALGLILNIFFPGVGSLVVGQTTAGVIQLVMFILSIPLDFVLIGVPLGLAAWIWALITGIQAFSTPPPAPRGYPGNGYPGPPRVN